MVVTSVFWVGGYWNQDPIVPNTTHFRIIFYNDDGGQPTGAGMPDPTSTSLYFYEIPIESVEVVSLGSDKYAYTATLPTSATFQASTTYWIAVQSVNLFRPQWGFMKVIDRQLNNARRGFPTLGTPYWESDLASDMAFRLTGYYDGPAPGMREQHRGVRRGVRRHG